MICNFILFHFCNFNFSFNRYYFIIANAVFIFTLGGYAKKDGYRARVTKS